MSETDAIKLLVIKGAPYLAACHLSSELVLVDYEQSGNDKVLVPYANANFPEQFTDHFNEYLNRVLWCERVIDTTYQYYDIWRPEHKGIEYLELSDLEYLKERGFIELQ